MGSEAPAYLELGPGESAAPIYDRLVVGRECAGVDDGHRLLLDDPEVSRRHCEITLDHEHSRASVVDVSTNGTRLNGVRLERGVTVPIRSGDRLAIGGVEAVFRSSVFTETSPAQPTESVRCPACRRRVPTKGNLVRAGANAVLLCPVCMTESEVSNVNRESFRWTLLPGRAPVLRPPDD